jgi:hypothetical protein
VGELSLSVVSFWGDRITASLYRDASEAEDLYCKYSLKETG